MAEYETLSRGGFSVEIASDSNSATIYDNDLTGPRPVGTLQRRRIYTTGPRWTAYATDGTEITSGDYVFGVFKRFVEHYAPHPEDTKARTSLTWAPTAPPDYACSNRQVWGQPRRAYQVTIYNQHAGTSHTAQGRTRRDAFNRALSIAGEAWLRTGGDKLTTLRTLFAESIMAPYYRTAPHCYASHPNGAGVEFRRVGP